LVEEFGKQVGKHVGELVATPLQLGKVFLEAGALDALLYYAATMGRVEVIFPFPDVRALFRRNLDLTPTAFPIQASSNRSIFDGLEWREAKV
jgi:hypothetical protein